MDVWYSRLFNVHAWSEHKQIADLVDEVFESLSQEEQQQLTGASRNKGKTDLKKHLRLVLEDQYVAWKTDPEVCTSISFNRNNYTVSSRYNGLHISPRVKDVCDILITNGYLDIAPGSYNRQNPGLGNRNSRIKPTPKLERLFKNVGLETFELSLDHNRECIILRDKDLEDNKAKDIEYEDTPQTNKMRAEVQAYNQMMLEHYVDVASLEQPFIIRDVKRNGRNIRQHVQIDQTQKFVRRIFSRSSWEMNGRWNGGFWQNLPKELRREILINDEPTDEIDYSGLHPSILALEAGSRLEGDPYDLGRQVVPSIPLNQQRAVVKLLVLIAINAKSRPSAFSAYRADHEKYKNNQLEPLLDAFIEKHPYLEDSICADQGIRLMNVDSEIATHVINRFVAEGKPILSIHDSFIVVREDQNLLRQAMSDACIAVVGADIEAESRAEKEQEHMAYATTWRDRDRDYFLDTFVALLVNKSAGYQVRYKRWLDRMNDSPS